MKKNIFIILLSLLTLNISAHIQHNFLRNILGVSAYDQVRYNMYDKGYINSAPHNKDYAVYRNVKFAGYTCEEADFHFYDNKFYMVSFIIGKTGNTKEIFESLKDKLQNKYPNYKYEEEENNIKFQDNTTLLILRNNTFDKTAENYLSLTYIDLNLSKKKIDDKISKNYSDEL